MEWKRPGGKEGQILADLVDGIIILESNIFGLHKQLNESRGIRAMDMEVDR